jgi:hypothetical protein
MHTFETIEPYRCGQLVMNLKKFGWPGDHVMYNLHNECGVLHTIAMKQTT